MGINKRENGVALGDLEPSTHGLGIQEDLAIILLERINYDALDFGDDRIIATMIGALFCQQLVGAIRVLEPYHTRFVDPF